MITTIKTKPEQENVKVRRIKRVIFIPNEVDIMLNPEVYPEKYIKRNLKI